MGPKSESETTDRLGRQTSREDIFGQRVVCRKILCGELTANAKKIIEYISLLKGKRITKDTLLIFDEVQECPNLVSALKYFCQDFREIPVITTGSLVRIKLQRETKKRGLAEKEKFLFPVGKINQITVYPLMK